MNRPCIPSYFYRFLHESSHPISAVWASALVERLLTRLNNRQLVGDSVEKLGQPS